MHNVVAIVECRDYSSEMLSGALDAVLTDLGGIERYAQPGEKVMIKPNFIRALPLSLPALTHPAIIAVLAEKIRSVGCIPAVGDSPAFGSLKSIQAIPGLKDILAPARIDMVPFTKGKKIVLPVSGIRGIRLASVLDEFPVVFNVPKLKAHAQLLISGAAKNLFGFVCGRNKAFQHFRVAGDLERFATMLAEIAAIVSPALTIVDGIQGLERSGPSWGDPYEYGVVIAGANVFAVDYTLAELFGLPWQRVPILRGARNAGLFDPEHDKVEIRGDSRIIRERFKAACLPGEKELVPISFTFPRLVKGFFRHVKESLVMATAAKKK